MRQLNCVLDAPIAERCHLMAGERSSRRGEVVDRIVESIDILPSDPDIWPLISETSLREGDNTVTALVVDGQP